MFKDFVLRCTVLSCVLYSYSVTAAEQVTVKKQEGIESFSSSPSLGSSVWQMGLGLLFVLGLILLLAWLMRRVTGIQGSKQHIKVLSAINVGNRERAVLVEVAGEQLLLGVAAGQVNLLHKIQSPIVLEKQVDFSNSLQKAAIKLANRSAVSKNTHKTAKAENNHS
ncbi:MAG: flagellar protein FliO/FliZ [Oceanospirillaceae bacterium]|jgi:flagellar protein FliO/FliZ